MLVKYNILYYICLIIHSTKYEFPETVIQLYITIPGDIYNICKAKSLCIIFSFF